MELVKPDFKYLQSYKEAIEEYKKNNIEHEFLDPDKYDIFQRIHDYHTGNNLPKNRVKATYLWLVEDNYFIGEISIRHTLTESLLRFGGNIGYGIRCSEWKKGFGTKILSLALIYAKNELGLTEVLITCNDDNYGSARVIEKNGGFLQDKIINNIDGKDRITRRYWIKIN